MGVYVKSYKDLMSSFKKIKEEKPVPRESASATSVISEAVKPEKIEPIREQYIKKEVFEQGTFVRHNTTNSIFQIVECCSNYLRVVDQFGRDKKVWLDAVSPYTPSKAMLEQFTPAVQGTQIFFKGYQTKNFTKEISQAFNSIIESADPFAVLSSIKHTDKFFATNDVEEKYNHFEQAGKFLSKLNLTEHTYRDTMEAELASMLFESIPDIAKITKNDRDKTAKLIAAALDIDASGSPVEVINRAAKEIVKTNHSPEALEIFGQLLQLASDVGIVWDRDLLTPSQLEKMGLVENVFNEETLTQLCNEAADSIHSFNDIIELYEAHELAAVSKNKVISLADVEGATITDRASAALKTNPVTDKEPKQLQVVETDPKRIARRAKAFALKYIKDRASRHSANKLSERERKRLEDIFANRGSIITNASKNLFTKLSKLEAERLNQEQQNEG